MFEKCLNVFESSHRRFADRFKKSDLIQMVRADPNNFKNSELYIYDFKTALKALSYVCMILRRLRAFKALYV